MSRNARVVKATEWPDDPVESATVAPHLYRYDGVLDRDGNKLADIALADDFNAAKACVPYGKGDVVYIDAGGKPLRAKVHYAFWDRDRDGERREFYLVLRETVKGEWSKVWTRVYAGHVQRGYHLAGLAPDLDGK